MTEITHSYGGDIGEPPEEPPARTPVVPHLVVQAGLASASAMGADVTTEADSGVD